MKNMIKDKIRMISFIGVLCLILFVTGCSTGDKQQTTTNSESASNTTKIAENKTDKVDGTIETTDNTSGKEDGSDGIFDLLSVPAFSDSAFVIINDNKPWFDESLLTNTTAFELYSELDELGRCGVAFANICKELMPTEPRQQIGHIKPSGWKLVKYDFVEGKYLYNRCHLIGFQLAGENDNEKNLITGTRYMNVDGMLPFENMIDDYVDYSGNHVLYRVTPIYEGDNLVASGVLMEAYSVEDKGDGICFNVYVYNNQPGVKIDYKTGASEMIGGATAEEETSVDDEKEMTYILNTKSYKFHLPSCGSVGSIKENNKEEIICKRYMLIDMGFSPCGSCRP